MKRTRGATCAGLACLALALASCSTRRPAPRPAPPRPLPAPPVERAATPADYVTTAGSIDLFVVQASERALARSADGRVRAIAARFAEEHRGLSAQLSMAGRRLDALPAARLQPREQQRLDALDLQRPFDAAYVRQMRTAHRQSLALHAAFAARGASATLRPVAANGVAVERGHLALLAGLPQ